MKESDLWCFIAKKIKNDNTLKCIVLHSQLTWNGLESLTALAHFNLDPLWRAIYRLERAHRVGQVRAVPVGRAGAAWQRGHERAAVLVEDARPDSSESNRVNASQGLGVLPEEDRWLEVVLVQDAYAYQAIKNNLSCIFCQKYAVPSKIENW